MSPPGGVSPPWAVTGDPFAQSPTNSFFTDANILEVKDDRLVAPTVTPSATTELVLWHRFTTEEGFDGSVLEISLDDGGNWDDVTATGGTFLEGNYNGTIDPSAGSGIAGPQAWTGQSQPAQQMQPVILDLSAFDGTQLLLRWRLVTDPLAPDPRSHHQVIHNVGTYLARSGVSANPENGEYVPKTWV